MKKQRRTENTQEGSNNLLNRLYPHNKIAVTEKFSKFLNNHQKRISQIQRFRNKFLKSNIGSPNHRNSMEIPHHSRISLLNSDLDFFTSKKSSKYFISPIPYRPCSKTRNCLTRAESTSLDPHKSTTFTLTHRKY